MNDLRVRLDAVRQHLPHVDVDNLGSRELPLHSVYDEGEWKMWWPDGKGGLCKMQGGKAIEACYFAKQPVNNGDIYLFIVNFLDQRANFTNRLWLQKAICSDIRNLATSLAKLELLFSVRDKCSDVISMGRMAETELEYIFLVCRSLFDLLQETIKVAWGTVTLFDPSVKKKDLPPSYRKMVLHDKRRMTIEEIVNKHQIPQAIAAAYYSTSPFFEWLREYRDLIAHSGRQFELVFVTEKGYAVSKRQKPFSNMSIWCDKNTLPNELGSLKSVACHVILTTLQALESMIVAFQSVIQFPPPIVPDYHVFMCGPNIHYLAEMEASVQERPWYEGTAVPVVAPHRQIAEAAYERWCKGGRQHGHDIDDWLAAERQLYGNICFSTESHHAQQP